MPAAKIRAGLIDPRGRPARAGAASAIADPRAGETPLARSVLAERLAIQRGEVSPHSPRSGQNGPGGRRSVSESSAFSFFSE